MVIKFFFLSILSLSYCSISWAENTIKIPSSGDDFYKLGINYGSPKENKPLLAKQYLEKAVQKGHIKATYVLGWMNYYGYGIEKDYEQAATLFKQAAQYKLAEAQHMLSILYSKGHGVKVDKDLAFDWTVKAAKNGHKTSQSLLSKLTPSLKR